MSERQKHAPESAQPPAKPPEGQVPEEVKSDGQVPEEQEAPEDAAETARSKGFLGRVQALTEERKKRDIRETITEFQSDAVEIEKGPPPRVARATTYALLALFATMIVWASLAHVDRVVTARGELMTTSPEIVVQPFETAVIKRLLVRPGDIVREGDILAKLDSTFAGADLDQLESQRSSFAAQIARLNAELSGEVYEASDPTDEHQVMQEAIFRQRHSAQQARLSDLDEQIKGAQATLKTLEDDAEVLNNRLKVAQQIEGMRQELQQQAVGSRLQLLVARDNRLQIARDLETTRNRRAEVQHQLRSLQAQREAAVSEWQQEAGSDLLEVTRRYDNVMDSLRKARRRSELSDLRAPQDGVVLKVADRTTGSVLQSGEALVTLVPLDSDLQAEVRISPSDVGLLTTGLPAKVKLDAFPFQKHGVLDGELTLISQNTFRMDNRPDGQSYYRGVVKLHSTKLRNVDEDTALLPGMTLTGEIKLGDRSVMSYFLYPLIQTFDESLREP